MKRVAAEIASQEPRIDILINNAGRCSPTAGSPKMASNALSH